MSPGDSAIFSATHTAVPTADEQDKNKQPQIGQIVDVVKDYVRQETLGPIKGAGRWLGRGVAGAFLIGTGCVFFILAGLRMVQNEFAPTFRGEWMSLLPYLFAFVFSLIVIGVAVWRITRKKTLQKESG
jgi:hypothetical protein